jgi:hypothetical protein
MRCHDGLLGSATWEVNSRKSIVEPGKESRPVAAFELVGWLQAMGIRHCIDNNRYGGKATMKRKIGDKLTLVDRPCTTEEIAEAVKRTRLADGSRSAAGSALGPPHAL